MTVICCFRIRNRWESGLDHLLRILGKSFSVRIQAMEISGVVSRRVPCFSGAGIDTHSSKLPSSAMSVDAGIRFTGQLRMMGSRDSKLSLRSRKFPGFCDNGHLQYYYVPPRCGGKKERGSGMVTAKKKLKLLKGLSKDLSMFSELGFGVDPESGLVGEVEGKMISEAAEVLLRQLQQLRAEEKELKRKRKEEKAKMKAARMKTMLECESESSESSEGECGEVIEMRHLRCEEALAQPVVEALQPDTEEEVTPILPISVKQEVENGLEERWSSCRISRLVTGGEASWGKRIEVCMGGKCKKSGGGALLEEFERAIGVEGAVVGCKCMGKCRDGPNVKVLNCSEGVENSVRTPTNPLCIGVGLEDVSVIVANFFGEDRNERRLAAAASAFAS